LVNRRERKTKISKKVKVKRQKIGIFNDDQFVGYYILNIQFFTFCLNTLCALCGFYGHKFSRINRLKIQEKL